MNRQPTHTPTGFLPLSIRAKNPPPSQIAPGKIVRALLFLALLLSMLGAAPAQPVKAADYAWTAYNDCKWASGQPNTRITTYACDTSGAKGKLVRHSDGAETDVTLTVAVSNVLAQTGGDFSAECASGTDCYDTFYGIASVLDGARLSSSASYVNLTLTGLDPAKTYTFAVTANRAGGTSYASRLTKFILQDATTATNASTGGVTKSTTTFADDTSTFSTGENTANGYVARWTGIQPGEDGDFTVNATSSTTASMGAVFMLAEEVTGPPSPTITTSGTLSAFSTTPGTPSAAQTYTVSGSNLTADISVQAPADFQISKDGSTWSSSLTLTQSGGTVGATTVHVRLNSSTEGSFSGDIAHTSSGATAKNVAVSGSVLYVYTLTVSNDGHGSVTLTPPGGAYNNGTTVTLTPAPDSGYVFGSWSGTNAGNIIDTGGVYTIVMNGDKSVKANFVAATCTQVSLEATADTHMRSGSQRAAYNYGGSTTIRVNPYYQTGSTDGQLTGSLYKWDLTSLGIPADATVSAASLTFYVTDASTYAFSLYNMRQAWVEGTNDGATGTGCSWNFYAAGTGSWGTTGAQSTTSDRYDTNLWDAAPAFFAGTGSQTMALNASGVAVVQGWVNGSLPNNGLTMQNYSGSSTDLWVVASRENTTYDGATLNITYCTGAAGPTITTSASALSAFSTTPGTPSAAQTYTVSGSNLTADISITAPAGFQISNDGSTWSSSLTLTQSGGTVGATTVHVRLNSATEGAFSGDIAHTSTGATAKNVAVSGSVLYVYTLTVSNDGHGSVTLTPPGGAYNNGTTVTLTPAPDSGYVFGSWSGTNAGNIIDTGGVYTIVMNGDKSVKANFVVSSCTDVSLVAAEDTYMSSANNTFNYGGKDSFSISNNYQSNGIKRGALIKWDLSGIPSGVTVSSASLTLYVSTASSKAYNLYNMMRGWVEGTSTGAASTTAVNWDTYDGANSWEAKGAAGITLDRYDSNLWGADTSSFASTGSKTLALNAAGIAVVQGWISGLDNHGLTIQDYTTTTGNDNLTISSSENTTTANRPTLNITYCTTPNRAPDQPTLVQPANGAAGVTTPPTLKVKVTDPDGDKMCVDFWGRQTGGEDFTMVVYPDTQMHAASAPAVFNAMTQYTVDNKAARNIVFATNVGDIVNTASNTTEWQRADTAYGILDTAGVPYSVGPGNHDIAFGNSTNYSTYFGKARFTGKSWYGGDYLGAGDNFNNYSLFSAGGMDFILINLQYAPGSGALAWADGLLKTYSNRRGIVSQHDILNINNSWNNQASYTALSNNPNLFLMLCGHMHSSSDGSAYRLEARTGMDPVHILMTNYQDFNTSPNTGFLRLLTFKPASDEIYAEVYSPYTGVSRTSPAGADYEQFTMAYDMAGEAAFQKLGQVCNISSGADASWSWTGLSADTKYEWYAVASDASESTTGPTWNFTTAAPACYALTLSHTGSGATPAASPANSAGCPTGQYVSGATINLSGAAPATGWGIAGWTGTNNNSSTASTNTVTMLSSAHSAGVTYLRLLGDVDKDGKVDSGDALIVLSADAGISTATYCPLNYGDVNGDGKVDSTDALIILTYDAKMSVPYPVGQPVPEPALSVTPPGCGP